MNSFRIFTVTKKKYSHLASKNCISVYCISVYLFHFPLIFLSYYFKSMNITDVSVGRALELFAGESQKSINYILKF